MEYNLKNKSELESARNRFNYLARKGVVIDLTEKRENRTLSQNNYLHLLLGAYAIEYGDPIEAVKQTLFKRELNPSIFVRTSQTGKEYLRSSADIDTGEMTTAIDRFKDYAAKGGINLPEANDFYLHRYIRNEIKKQRRFL